MKFFVATVTAVFLCFYVADGLKCISHIEAGPKATNVDCNDTFCYMLTFHNAGLPDSIDQGCGSDLTSDEMNPFNISACTDNGSQDFHSNDTTITLYCCDKDLCNALPTTNSATFVPFFGTMFFLSLIPFVFL